LTDNRFIELFIKLRVNVVAGAGAGFNQSILFQALVRLDRSSQTDLILLANVSQRGQAFIDAVDALMNRL